MRIRPTLVLRPAVWLLPVLVLVAPGALSAGPPARICARTLTAEVVALDQPFFWNRMGAVQPQGMIFALARDVVPQEGTDGGPGRVQLRRGKRARPLVLRMNEGDCLQITFHNLLAPRKRDKEQPATRTASVHVVGLELVESIADDGSNVGRNPDSLVPTGGTAVYTLYAEREGPHLLYSSAATTGGQGDGGSLAAGLFGAVIVEPRGALWYRSQLTAEELALATKGRTAAGQPLVDWAARYPTGHPRAGLPVLQMLDGTEIVHSDVFAIVAGPERCGAGTPDPARPGRFCPGTYADTPVLPDRLQPFREFVTVYHDEIGAVQAFPHFEHPVLSHTLHGVRDGFAINYGSSGAGAIILANRLGVGPARDCAECKYEEFFLSSWPSGDPALLVDVPANARARDGQEAPRATRALFPDDPSNVYHSYLNDHVKFRILHAGPKEHHIHHQHTHQWPHTPDSPNASYLDSQAMGPAAAFTLEMVYGGSGNRNRSPGDSIFHCHFYPHFAQGMWGLWRVHDVFETGTALDRDGRPAPGSRALPDGDIAAGTPIPAVVPLPTLAMAPMPTPEVPGYPFFIPARAGRRAPHPPLDLVDDGGLPRHRIAAGTAEHAETRLDFHKRLLTAEAVPLPEAGTASEQAAMRFHATSPHPSFLPDGTAAGFLTNGLPPQPGAPFADPCTEASGRPAGTPRTFRAAAFELDPRFNKAGWHYPQWRMEALWEDVDDFLGLTLSPGGATPSGRPKRAPEPFFFRSHSRDCITFHHTTLTPHETVQDDFQVRAPTDVLGQHIHLVKFDVLASDGAGNGFNYEDGTFAPDEVRERIRAIRARNGCRGADSGDRRDGTFPCPVARPHPFFGAGPDEDGDRRGDWIGAQTTVQRWYADPTLDGNGRDRTLRTVFTHDHFSPSTHQQAGLYAGLVIEPEGSRWRDPETGELFGTRASDGGPTSWRADILTARPEESFREFLVALQDFALAYTADGKPVNPPAREEEDLPIVVLPAEQCPGEVPRPCPEAISADDVGTMLVNYRNEPIPLRVRDPESGRQAEGEAGDLSYVFSSEVERADERFGRQPDFYPPLTRDVAPRDPFTPLLRAYENDRVEIRVLIGAHEEGHDFSIHGVKWLFETDEPNSGFRNSQMMGISEHFEFRLPPLANPVDTQLVRTDRLYLPGSSVDDMWNGLWGLLRAYRFDDATFAEVAGAASSDHPLRLLPLPSNPRGRAPDFRNRRDFLIREQGFEGTTVCPARAYQRRRKFEVAAVAARQALLQGTLVYNPRPNQGGALADPTAILYVLTRDLDEQGRLRPGVPVEPLILRANAGDCIEVRLHNRLPPEPFDLPGFNTLPMIVERFNANQVAPSVEVGLHPQLVAFDARLHNGVTAGVNPFQTAQPDPGDAVKTYLWYAGDYRVDPDGTRRAVPIELGAIGLLPSDPIKHSNKGAVGALVVEPAGATWKEDAASRATATVTLPGGRSFRELVLVFQDDINLRWADPVRFTDRGPVPLVAREEDSEDSGHKAFNYRTEPLWKRLGYPPDTPLEETRDLDFSRALANVQAGGDPVTPLLTAAAGVPVRFRLVQPGGHQRNHVFQVHGHLWQEEPYTRGSTVLGDNPLSEWMGSQTGIGPTSHFDLLIGSAGGPFRVPGDYLYRDFQSFQFDGGLWGLLRVGPAEAPRSHSLFGSLARALRKLLGRD